MTSRMWKYEQNRRAIAQRYNPGPDEQHLRWHWTLIGGEWVRDALAAHAPTYRPPWEQDQ